MGIFGCKLKDLLSWPTILVSGFCALSFWGIFLPFFDSKTFLLLALPLVSSRDVYRGLLIPKEKQKGWEDQQTTAVIVAFSDGILF